jgi:hypothetical protein
MLGIVRLKDDRQVKDGDDEFNIPRSLKTAVAFSTVMYSVLSWLWWYSWNSLIAPLQSRSIIASSFCKASSGSGPGVADCDGRRRALRWFLDLMFGYMKSGGSVTACEVGMRPRLLTVFSMRRWLGKGIMMERE